MHVQEWILDSVGMMHVKPIRSPIESSNSNSIYQTSPPPPTTSACNSSSSNNTVNTDKNDIYVNYDNDTTIMNEDIHRHHSDIDDDEQLLTRSTCICTSKLCTIIIVTMVCTTNTITDGNDVLISSSSALIGLFIGCFVPFVSICIKYECIIWNITNTVTNSLSMYIPVCTIFIIGSNINIDIWYHDE